MWFAPTVRPLLCYLQRRLFPPTFKGEQVDERNRPGTEVRNDQSAPPPSKEGRPLRTWRPVWHHFNGAYKGTGGRQLVSRPLRKRTGDFRATGEQPQNDQLTELSDTQLELLLTQLANEDPAVRFGEATLLFNGALANDLLTKDQLRHAMNTLKSGRSCLTTSRSQSIRALCAG